MANGVDASDVTAVGPGLVNGQTGDICHFNVYINRKRVKQDVKDCLDFYMEGPSEPIPLKCGDNLDDGSIDVTYSPILPGEYRIYIRCNGQNIHGSPFRVIVAGESIRQHLMTSKVAVSGKGLKVGKLLEENEVLVDVGSHAISGGLKVSIAGPRNATTALRLNHVKGSEYRVTYCPTIAGHYYLYVKIGYTNIPNSPFAINVR